MYQENDIKDLVRDVLTDMLKKEGGSVSATAPVNSQRGQSPVTSTQVDDGFARDITAEDTKHQYFVPNAEDPDGYMRMKQTTPARIGVWRAGTRYNTWSQLRFLCDHAAAQDSVFTDVSEECIKENGLLEGKTRCESKDEYITRPDLGRYLDDETKTLYKSKLKSGAKVTVMVGDGLSSAAIEANVADILPALRQGLKSQNIEIDTVPFVKYCRVGAMDDVGELLGSDVVCLLIGERPGLVTAESMSAYICYRPNHERPESWRTVLSNIHRGGTPPVEAGAYIADLIKRILDEKVSGVDLAL